jgi:hypothetical protein
VSSTASPSRSRKTTSGLIVMTSSAMGAVATGGGGWEAQGPCQGYVPEVPALQCRVHFLYSQLCSA